jgi:hypothetical protein
MPVKVFAHSCLLSTHLGSKTAQLSHLFRADYELHFFAAKWKNISFKKHKDEVN